MQQLTCSIVLYNTDRKALQKAISSFLQSEKLLSRLYLIDNSETDDLKSLANDKRIEYIFNDKNLGYGKAHNIALKKAVEYSKYHLILNPDIEFETGVLENIYQYMEEHEGTGLLLPKVFYNDGKLQKLCNLLPRPVNLIGRRFFEKSVWVKKINDAYELKGFDYNQCLNVPNLSGCFMFLRCEVLKKVGFFDERYFMYMEDVDLCRRIHAVSETIFYPDVSIVHGFEKESYNNARLLKHHIISAIKYFNKWGWISDPQRDHFNKQLSALLINK